MADGNTITNGIVAGTGQTEAARSPEKKNGEIGQAEFLNLLVAQLKNQDPLEPMKNDQFAVNLAQFSSLEQLISINKKIAPEENSDLTSLTAYLGHEVTLNTDQIRVQNHSGGLIKLDLERDASAVRLELVDAAGAVVETAELSNLTAGKHTVALDELDTADGSFTVRAKVIAAAGGSYDGVVNAAGIVTGFVPGPTPRLLMGDQEVDPAEVIEVGLPRVY